ncbi:MAG: hypothetical protein SynsKO_30030 [Synoicihabitans sp.]
MRKTEIIAQLPRLSAQDRTEIWEQIWRIEEESGVTEPEKLILDEAQAAFNNAPEAGSSWEEVETRLRNR